MKLSAEDRAVLFRTENIQNQMQKFLLNRPEYRATEEEIRTFFSDVSVGMFQSTLTVLCTRGIIRKESGSYILEKSRIDMVGDISDKVWRAIRIEKAFTVESISYLTGLSSKQVQRVLCKLEKQGLIVCYGINRVHMSSFKLYRIVSDSIARPIKQVSNDSLSRLVWTAVYDLKGNIIPARKITAKIENSISQRYARRILQWFCKEGYIRINHLSRRECVYEIPDDFPEKYLGNEYSKDMNNEREK